MSMTPSNPALGAAAGHRFPGWGVVAASGVGIAFCSTIFVAQCFTLLAAALAAQYGWTQPQLAKAASIVLLTQLLVYPICGRAIDRWGSRKVGSASILLFAAALIVLSRVGNSLSGFYLAFALIGLIGTGTNVITYARAITLWFDRRRGLALGLAAASQAIGAVVMPLLMQKIIATSGWPMALAALAAIEVAICFPLVALFVKDRPEPYGWRPDGDRLASRPAASVSPAAPGLPGAVAPWRQASFWKMFIAFAVMGGSYYAWATNAAFILTTTAGMSLADVATVQALGGVSLLFGRVAFGWLLDRMSVPRVALCTLVLSALFFLLLATSSSRNIVFLAAVIGGFSFGGEADLMPYLAGRYFGAGAVSKVYGYFLSAFVLGAVIAPVAFAQASASYGGPIVPLYALTALGIVPMLLFLSLGPARENAPAHQ